MAKKKYFTMQNNFPLLVTLVMIVFVIPLTVFAVGFNKMALGTQAQEQQSANKEYKAAVGQVEVQAGKNNTKLFLLKTPIGKINKLVGTLTGPSSFDKYVGKSVLVEGWVNYPDFYVTSISLATKSNGEFDKTGFIVKSADNQLTDEGIYYFNVNNATGKTGYLILNPRDNNLYKFEGKKVSVKGSLWNLTDLDKDLVAGMEIVLKK